MSITQLKKIVVSGIIGTSAMTIFSYLVSKIMGENFREPEILAILIKNMLPTATPYAIYLGWVLHYLIGFAFVVVYVRLWDNNQLKPNVASGILLGAISGIIGIIGWYIVLKLHPNPPLINLINYFILLFFAHIVFGIFALVGYGLIKKADTVKRLS